MVLTRVAGLAKAIADADLTADDLRAIKKALTDLNKATKVA